MPALSGRQAGRGGEAPETKGTSAAAAGRAGRGCPRKSAPEASSGAPAPELLTFGATSFLFCEEPQRFCFHHLLSILGLKNSPRE